MNPPVVPPKKSVFAAFAILLGVVAGGALVLPSMALTTVSVSVITVVFNPDDMGFEATSSKDLSNIIVEVCGTQPTNLHKHEVEFTGAGLKVFNHTELVVIYSVYVKSGNNGIAGNDPPGAGERFLNAGASCSPPTTSIPPSSTTTAPPTWTTTVPPSSTTTAPPSSTTTAPPVTTTAEIPVFPSATALALATFGAIGGAFLLMRRRN